MAVLEPSPAAKAGVQAGDEVLSINGKATESLTNDELEAACRVSPGAMVILKLRPVNGQEREVRLTAEKLL